MALVPDAPQGTVDVEGDADAFAADISPAPADTGPDAHGITTLGDVALRGLSGGVATVVVRGRDDLRYALVLWRGGSGEVVHLTPRADGAHAAEIGVGAGEQLHLSVVASDSEAALRWLEAEVGAGGFGMGGGDEATAEPPAVEATAEPPAVDAPMAPDLAPVPAFPDMVDSDAFPDSGTSGGDESWGDDSEHGDVVDAVVDGGGGRDLGLAPAPPPPADAVADGGDATTDGGADGEAAEPDVDGAARVDAHVAAQMPADLFEGVPFDVTVTLSREEIRIAKGHAGDDTVVAFHKKRDIRIAIQCTGFDVAPGTPSELIARLPARGEPEDHRFQLVPGTAGIGRVRVTITQDPEVTPLATIELSTMILPADEAPPVAPILPATPNRAETGATAPPKALTELPTIVIEETTSRGHSVLTTIAKVGAASATNTVCLLDKEGFVDGVYKKLGGIRDAYRDALKAGVEERIAVARAEEGLRELGAGIADTLLGDEVNTLLWSKRRRLQGLMVQTSGELDIPWEIVHLVRVGDADPDDASYFLGDQGLTRWLWGTPRPTELSVQVDRVIGIAPDYADPGLKLTATEEEVRALYACFERDVPPPLLTRDEVSDHIRGGFDLLHFAGHGRWRTADPRAQEIALAAFVEAQDDGSASYRHVDVPEHLVAGASPPFVFLSACDVGRLQPGTTGPGGFAEAFLRGGAGVFIGCSWAVRDDVTAAFATTLYAELFTRGATLGEAVAAARIATREAHDLTALAFTVFADPRARVVRT
ncbi:MULTISPECIES: CHAT domain-containing protein [Microbacterium]|uniref:CHAT domain-containing protein n=1 Tax=Microbacterium TaxID=33882 RepID=UPI000D64ED87|nr:MULTISPECIES: CHAT domain-containing protein [Microbacterium]